VELCGVGSPEGLGCGQTATQDPAQVSRKCGSLHRSWGPVRPAALPYGFLPAIRVCGYSGYVLAKTPPPSDPVLLIFSIIRNKCLIYGS
jgi:hypothetical protein